MNRQQRRAAAKQPTAPSVDGLFARALAFHQTGDLAQAEPLYRQILASAPQHLDSLNLLGALLTTRGDPAGALQWIIQAQAVNPNVPEVHNNHGVTLEGLGRLEEAATCYLRALDLRPGFLDALTNLGNVRFRQGDDAGAAAALSQALSLNPNLPDAHNVLGVLLHRQGQIAEAAASFDRAASLRPDFGLAFRNLGLALLDLRRFEEAAACFDRALSLLPRDVEAIFGMAAALQSQGRILEALLWLRDALAAHETAELKGKFAEIASIVPHESLDLSLAPLLARAVAEPWARPAALVSVSLALLDRIAPEAALRSPLLAALLTSTPIADQRWEGLLTARRRALLLDGLDDLEFACNLARQCFITEYSYAEQADETGLVDALANRVARDPAGITPIDLATLACYRALGGLIGAEALTTRDWPPALRGVLTQQVLEPLEEADLAAALPALTPIDDQISREVRAQYEENPYPRWVRAAPPGAPVTLDHHLRRQLPDSPYRPLGVDTGLSVLIAGTGTGQQVIETARRYRHAEVLGIDLSRASLGYAARMARSLGLGNLTLAQADILRLGSLDRRFHLIESGGVLHHMADPLAGWRVLVSLLHGQGVMRIGLYSDIGRKDVTAAQRLIGARESTPAALRQLRQDLIAQRGDPLIAGILNSSDFYSLSECRDLLLHVHEHRLTLPVIADWIDQLGLRFLGFECPPDLIARYRQRFPLDRSMTDLAAWHVFETENPDSFIGMYQFWVQKA